MQFSHFFLFYISSFVLNGSLYHQGLKEAEEWGCWSFFSFFLFFWNYLSFFLFFFSSSLGIEG